MVIVLIVVLIGAYSALDLLAPLPSILPTSIASVVAAPGTLVVKWPTASESSVGLTNYGVIATNGAQAELPTASIAKMVVALSVLSKHPLVLGQQGPTITITPADVADYNKFVALGGSVVKVTVGEQITEYQALQAMLIPSANNMADTLASWAFDSTANYLTFANKLVASYGMKHTVITDPSGFTPSTVSTSDDLILLGEQSLANPVLAQIVSQKSATVPVEGEITNVNFLLGTDDVIGIKTGNTNQAGGCFLAAAQYTLPNNQTMTVITSVMNAPSIFDAVNETAPMLQSIKNQIEVKTIPAGFKAVKYSMPWGSSVYATTDQSTTSTNLPGLPLKYSVNAIALSPPTAAGTLVGNTVFGAISSKTTASVSLSQAIKAPSVTWRLLHPKYIFSNL